MAAVAAATAKTYIYKLAFLLVLKVLAPPCELQTENKKPKINPPFSFRFLLSLQRKKRKTVCSADLKKATRIERDDIVDGHLTAFFLLFSNSSLAPAVSRFNCIQWGDVPRDNCVTI